MKGRNKEGKQGRKKQKRNQGKRKTIKMRK
jgi:hypothetical protein